MGFLKKSLLLLVIPLLAFSAHKFYVSVTNVNYSEKEDALQITTRIFVDDFEQVIEERYGVKMNLATADEDELAEQYIEKYLRAKFAIEINGENRAYTYLGKQYDDDVMICYLELPKLEFDKVKSIQIQNEVLTDLFDEQQNIVHFKINGIKKSFVLIRENNKGMLNL
ncbi:DUF6702 family protein [Poritiphilus flavus]|uniref:Peptidase E n=1 Tax=Poritiphilus flavus TaxID=2697053 RepID=A0A6L9EHJ5_9FLAO|nr:DUF6702 family protein [Poritiphilus flavus]NAS14122.1 hypothetical protein [Poritiphilus flavus]